MTKNLSLKPFLNRDLMKRQIQYFVTFFGCFLTFGDLVFIQNTIYFPNLLMNSVINNPRAIFVTCIL